MVSAQSAVLTGEADNLLFAFLIDLDVSAR